jgi:hypothetical protein
MYMHLALIQLQIHRRHVPRRFDPQNPPKQFSILHRMDFLTSAPSHSFPLQSPNSLLNKEAYRRFAHSAGAASNHCDLAG